LHRCLAGANASSGRTQTRALAVIRLLLQAGVDVNATDDEGWTAVHVAASWQLHEATAMLVSTGKVDGADPSWRVTRISGGALTLYQSHDPDVR